MTEISLPTTVNSIEDYAFFYCDGLEEVNLPWSLTTIGKSAFNQCSSLKAVSLPNSVTSIGNGTFTGCTDLTDVYLPPSIVEIGHFAFYETSSLGAVSLPDSVTSVGSYAFSYSGLLEISLSSSITHIGDGTFAGCPNLENVSLPSSVTHIGQVAFASCTSLEMISLPHSVTIIGRSAFFESSLRSVYISDADFAAFQNRVVVGGDAFANISVGNIFVQAKHHFIEGPSMSNGPYSDGSGPNCYNDGWMGTLEEAAAACHARSGCYMLHDSGCDGNNWRYCMWTVNRLKVAFPAGEDACTMVKQAYVKPAVADFTQSNLPGIQSADVAGHLHGNHFIFSWLNGGFRKMVRVNHNNPSDMHAGYVDAASTTWTDVGTWTDNASFYSLTNLRLTEGPYHYMMKENVRCDLRRTHNGAGRRFRDAAAKCNADPTCGGVYDYQCDGAWYTVCDVGFRFTPLSQGQGCVYTKQANCEPDTWVTDFGSDPTERCQEWAANDVWGALANGSTIDEACQDPWAAENCAQTCCLRTKDPTPAPTFAPTAGPTYAPTKGPTDVPTDVPTDAPTDAPTVGPTSMPTVAPAPTAVPTRAPTDAPTPAPTPVHHYVQSLNTRCTVKRAHNGAGGTLAQAQQACSLDPTCGGVWDLPKHFVSPTPPLNT
jgi:hypothetical protein